MAVSIPDYILFAGTTISVTCKISLSESVDNNVSLHADWLSENNTISNDTNRTSVSLLFGAKSSFTSILTISPLSDLENNTKLTCRASASSFIDFITASGNGENSTLLYIMQRCQFYMYYSIMCTVRISNIYILLTTAPSAPNITLGETTSTSIHVASMVSTVR